MPRGNQVHDRNMTTGSSEPLLVDAGKPQLTEADKARQPEDKTRYPWMSGSGTTEAKPEKVARTKDGELLAIGRIVRILDALPDDAARRRVVCYVSDRWHDERDQ